MPVVAQPIIMKQIIDEGIPNKDLGFVAQQGFIMVLVAIVSLQPEYLAKFASIAGTKLQLAAHRKTRTKTRCA